MKKLNQRQAWARLAGQFQGYHLGLCHAIHVYYLTGWISFRVSERMMQTLSSIRTVEGYFWPIGEDWSAHRRILAGLLAKGNIAGAKAFVKHTHTNKTP